MTVRGNRISRAAFSGVRGKAASNLQAINNIINDVGDVAVYSEFGFEGAVIANNTIDGAALGVAVVNFNEGGRLAVVQGNLIRNLKSKRPGGTTPKDGARRHRHHGRGRRCRHRQRDRERAGYRHQARLGRNICAT